MTSTASRPRRSTVADLFEAGAAHDSQAVAVVAGASSLTYGQLDAGANRLAHHLRALGVGPGEMVGVFLGRSLDLAVALLAVLKAGGACVPLDPSYPTDRLRVMLEDAAPEVVLTSTALAARLPDVGPAVILVDADADRWTDQPADAPPPRATTPADVAYVIYTSGSTGRPRGVLLTHGGLVNHHCAVIDLYGLGPGDRVLQFCSIGFDASVEELFPTWASGATVVFRPEDVPLLGRDWLAWLRDNAITVLNLPTAYWHAWVQDLERSGQPVPDAVRLLVVGGEKALGPAYRTWCRIGGDQRRWLNVYGPAETTCMSTYYEPAAQAEGDGDGDPPIGRPIANTVVRVVDDNLQRVAPGTVGELLIGGAGLARGYLNQPALTAERFVDDPDPAAGDGRFYRTGDLVRERPDGNLEFVGRIDDQVKVRGFRVDCGEVEAALIRHPGVAQAAVVARNEPGGGKGLVAFVVGAGAEAPDAGELRRFLSQRLPAFLVPGSYAVLDALPVTPNGKVDRAPLRARDVAMSVAGRRAGTATEERVAAIWARLLGREGGEVGVDDDFFLLGGHSLLATQVIAQVREEFGTETPLRAIFEAPTVAGLAAVVDREQGARAPAAEPPELRRRQRGVRIPLSLAQEQMWNLEAGADPPGLYNFTALRRLDPAFDAAALQRALASLVERHEILRTGFAVDGDGPRQVVAAGGHAAVPVAVHDVEDAADVQRRIAEQDATPFDLGRPPLLRAAVYRHGSSARLAVTFDHLVCDGTSATLFMDELDQAYAAEANGHRPDLPPVDLQFGDFAVWQRARVTDEVLRGQLDWWATALDGMALGPAVPFDHRPDAPTRRIAKLDFTVPAGTRRLLDELATATRSTVFMVAVAAAQVALGARGGVTDVAVSTTLSGRTRAELEPMIGMFSGIGRIRTDLSGDPHVVDVVAQVRNFVLGMFDNQDIPFMRVRRAVLPHFPTGGIELVSALPVELQYFRIRPDRPDAELFFRGQLHPLSVTLLDDRTEIAGEISYKVDFYEHATIAGLAADFVRTFEAVGRTPSARLSELRLG